MYVCMYFMTLQHLYFNNLIIYLNALVKVQPILFNIINPLMTHKYNSSCTTTNQTEKDTLLVCLLALLLLAPSKL